MAIQWAIGGGDRNVQYGDESDQSQDVRNIPTLNWARNRYREKNEKEEEKGSCCDKNKLQSVTNVKSSFGVIRYIEAGFTSCAWSFLGSFRVDVYPVSCHQAKFVVTNNSSFTSFTGGIFPSWNNNGPMSNFYQTYTWEENL